MPNCAALPANTSITFSTHWRKSKSCCSISILPDSIFEKSKISLITPSKASPLVLIICTYSSCSGLKGVSASNDAMPITPFIGVRISWLMVARNTLLAAFACSASFLAWSASALCSTSSTFNICKFSDWLCSSSACDCKLSFITCKFSDCTFSSSDWATSASVLSSTNFSSTCFWLVITVILRRYKK